MPAVPPNALRVCRNVCREHPGLTRWYSRHTVMLGHQKAQKTQLLYVPGVLSHLIQWAGCPAV